MATKKKQEPTVVESVDLVVGDAHVVLSLDDAEFRLSPDAVEQLRRQFDAAHIAVNPGH